jgi:hypothetical protein
VRAGRKWQGETQKRAQEGECASSSRTSAHAPASNGHCHERNYQDDDDDDDNDDDDDDDDDDAPLLLLPSPR